MKPNRSVERGERAVAILNKAEQILSYEKYSDGLQLRRLVDLVHKQVPLLKVELIRQVLASRLTKERHIERPKYGLYRHTSYAGRSPTSDGRSETGDVAEAAPQKQRLSSTTLEGQLREILGRADMLPENPQDAVSGSELIQRVRSKLTDQFADASVRASISRLAHDSTSPVAKVQGSQGYYSRSHSKHNAAGSTDKISPLDRQLEEKFRAVLKRHLEVDSGQCCALLRHHTSAAKRPKGQNKWQFPDLVSLEWDKGLVADDRNQNLDPAMLRVMNALQGQPFTVTSHELKVTVSLPDLRSCFFQCLSNSRWAHKAQLSVAGDITDEALTDELRRLGESFGVAVVSYGLDESKLSEFPDAESIRRMDDGDIERLTKENQMHPTTISSGQERPSLDWGHINNVRSQNEDFQAVFGWMSYCLEHKEPYAFEDYRRRKTPT